MKYFKINIPERFGDSGLLKNLREEISNYEGSDKVPLMWHNDEEPRVKVRTNYREVISEFKLWYSKYITHYLTELVYPFPMSIKWWNHYKEGHKQGIHHHDSDSNPRCVFGSVFYVFGATPTVLIEPDGKEIRPEVKDGDFLLFESSVPHYAEAESERITVTANFYEYGNESKTLELLKDWDNKMENRGFEVIAT